MHVSDEDLILHYYGEPTGNPGIERHLAACPECRAELTRLEHVLAMVDAQQAPEPRAGFERDVWARLQPALPDRQASWWSRLFHAPPRWALAGGMAAIVLAAFLAGRFTQPVVPASPSQVAGSTDAAEGVLLAAVGDHLDSSQMILIELLNGDADQAGGIEGEQSRARELVAANRLYRQTAALSGEDEIGALLDELERVLLEIANAPADASAGDLERLRAHIAARGLLFRVRVVQSEMRERERERGEVARSAVS
jgi:hypothetical protein